MAEPSLSMNFEELKSQVAFHLYGGVLAVSSTSTFDLLETGEKEVVKAVVRSGMRGFYNPPPIRQRKAHKWSFLDKTDNLVLNAPITGDLGPSTGYVDSTNRITVASLSGSAITNNDTAAAFLAEIDGVSYPIASYVNTTTLVLDANDNPGADVAAGTAYRLHQDDYSLPDDFGRLIDPLTYVEKENSWYSVEIVGEGRIRELRQRDYIGTNGTKPQVAAIRTLSGDAIMTTGTRKQIMFWPAVSDDFVMKMQYRVRPQDDLADADYPYGVTDHAETILYSCLAEAERRLDETQGVYYQRFIESLASSIDLDSRSSGAHTLGYNSDRSDVGSAMGREYLFGSRIRHKNTSGTYID